MIINIGSIESVRGFASDTAYVVAKGDQIPCIKALAIDSASLNNRTNNILPGFFASLLNAQRRGDHKWKN